MYSGAQCVLGDWAELSGGLLSDVLLLDVGWLPARQWKGMANGRVGDQQLQGVVRKVCSLGDRLVQRSPVNTAQRCTKAGRSAGSDSVVIRAFDGCEGEECVENICKWGRLACLRRMQGPTDGWALLVWMQRKAQTNVGKVFIGSSFAH